MNHNIYVQQSVHHTFQSRCACGWQGPWCGDFWQAKADGVAHDTAIKYGGFQPYGK